MRNIDKRYIATFLACCLFILSIGLNNAYSIFVVPLADAMATGRGTITLASTITDLVCSTLSPVLVILLRRVPLRRLLLTGTLAYSLVLLGIAFFQNIYIFFLLNIIKGFVFIVYGCNVIIIVLGNWFEKGRETLIGIAMAFTGLGGAVFSQIFSYIMERTDLRFTFIVFAVLTVVLALPSIYYLKLKPEEMGLPVLKGESVQEEKRYVTHERKYRFNDPAFIGICAVYFIMVFLTNVSIHFPGYADTIGFGRVGASMVSWMMVGSIFFKAGMGAICDRFGPKAGFPVSIALVFASFVMIIIAKGEMMLLIGSFIFGSIFSSLIVLNPMIRYCFGNEQYPEVFSKVMVVSAISNMGGPIVGYLYDFTGTYVTSLYAAVVLCIVAITCYAVTMQIVERDV